MATQYTAGLSVGQVLTADTMNSIGAAWETWTPTVTQSGNVTVTNQGSRYGKIQKIIVADMYLTVTGSGTGGNKIVVSLPATAKTIDRIGGVGFVYDASATQIYVVAAYFDSATNVGMYVTNASAAPFGNSPNVALAVNDQIRLQLMYEAA